MAKPSASLSIRPLTILLVAAVTLTACAYAQPNPTPPYFTGQYGPGDPTVNRVGGPQGLSLTFGPYVNPTEYSGGPPVYPGSAPGVDAFLWRGALDTLSSTPLASVDPFGGVILTDWYTRPGDTGERFKTAVYMDSREPRGDGLRVSVFREVYRNGNWVGAPVSPALQTDIRNSMLTRARQLRRTMPTGQG
jgi:hypothetical protein